MGVFVGSLMDWDAIGAIGETVGALAVVISLIYLAVQIRNQNLESKAATVQQVLQHNAATISQLQDPDLAQIWITGLGDIDALSDVERLRFVMYITTVLRDYENAYFQWRNGRLDDETWFTLMAVVRDVKSTPMYSQILEIRRHHFRPEVIKYMDELEVGDYSYIKKTL